MILRENWGKITSLILQPTRTLIIIFLLSQLLTWKIPWESSTMIFYGFIGIFASSYFSEAVITYKINGFLATLKELYIKYVMLFPLEFLGVYIHAHLSFFPDSDITRYWQTVAFVIAIGNAVSVEAYYYFIVPRLNNKKLSNRGKILVVIAMVFMIFVLMLHACFISKIC